VESDRHLHQHIQTSDLNDITLQKRLIKKSGDIVWAELRVTLIRDEQGHPAYSLCMLQDITQAKQLMAARDQAEATLRQQAQRDRLLRVMTTQIHQSFELDQILAIAVTEVRHVLNADRALVFQLRPDGTGVVVQEALAAGMSPTANDGHPVSLSSTCCDLYRQGRPHITNNLEEDDCVIHPVNYLRSVNTHSKITAPILQMGETRNAARLWGLLIVDKCPPAWQWQPSEADLLQQIADQLAIAIQQASLYQQTQTELAERQQAEVHLQSLLQEKEILLQEVHHRVKNNLQIISSLLRMQSRLVDANTRALFQETQNRVQAIAAIHEHLYQLSDISQINFAEYVQILVNNLLRSYGVSSQQIQITLNIQPIALSFNLAISCGLIINELVSNSLKYAFGNDRAGKITISLASVPQQERTTDHQVALEVKDNGVGMAPDFNWQTSRSLGLRIVRTLVHQMDGMVTLDCDRGTVFRIVFPYLASPVTPASPIIHDP